MRKYWLSGPKNWTFSTVEKTPEGRRRVELIRASHITIRRHAKVKSEGNPFDPKDDEYFRKRKAGSQCRSTSHAAAKNGMKGQ